MNRIRRLSLAFAVAGVLGVAAPAAASALSTITISGATASYPLVSLLAQKYVKTFPEKSEVQNHPGRRADRRQRRRRRTRLDRRRLARPARGGPAGLVFYPIAKYGICVITNKSNPLPNLTQRAGGLDLHRQNAQLERRSRARRRAARST